MGRLSKALILDAVVALVPVLGVATALLRPTGLDDLDGFEAEVGRQVLADAHTACFDSPLRRLGALRLRLRAVWLKDVIMTDQRGQPVELDAVPRRQRRDPDYRYHYQAELRGYTVFGIPASRFTISGERDGESADCQPGARGDI